MSKNNLTIKAPDGGQFNAYIATPDVTPAPAIIVIQEIFGINQELRDKCENFAAKGYLAICPDLFWRIEPGIELSDSVPEQLQRAFHLFGEFDQKQGIKDLEATLKTLRALKECDGHVGAVGYCLGGKLAYMMAAETDINAAVSYYGVGLGAMLGEAEKIEEPILLHIAADDEFVPKDEQEQIIAAMEEHPKAEIYRYPGVEHAFARGNGMHYNEQAAKLANHRTAEFLSKNMKLAKAA
jgi:carboxymethylenebutenolidase